MLRNSELNGTSYYSQGPRSPMDDYLERITRMQRTPTEITDYPHFPNVHEIFINNLTHADNQKSQNPKPSKKVHIVEQEKDTEAGKHEKVKVIQGKTIDFQADGFIKWNHKNFALCKWDTFKG
ncbi:S-adenosyl-L-methionine-dependentmethyltransferases superfamily protein [Striga asiatica]|uniref:S-adenosyl-L-methionine-dependentmethyltransferases superfamily protein n=1 Tax=Striga asiatica TaxID=4170 RepID=A0A5A7P397_STRAF|nr:S-adenosyl-L-methionine-dependentmethyltransferases superfamily protein [Striga asiatica]